MRVRRLVWLVLLATIVTLGTGASKHRIEDRWTDPDYERKEHRKLLVIAITEDSEARAIFEDRFVSHLRGKRPSASRSSNPSKSRRSMAPSAFAWCP